MILLTEANQASGSEAASSDAITIAYQRGRGALVARALLLLVILALTAYLVELPRQLRERAAQNELLGGLFGAAIMLGFVSILSGGLLLRHGLTRPTRRELADGLRARLYAPATPPR